MALDTLSKKKRRNKLKPGSSQCVVDARIKLKSISSAYHKAASQCTGVDLSKAKKQLEDAYLDVEVDYISGKFNGISRYHISNKHHLAWKTAKDFFADGFNYQKLTYVLCYDQTFGIIEKRENICLVSLKSLYLLSQFLNKPNNVHFFVF